MLDGSMNNAASVYGERQIRQAAQYAGDDPRYINNPTHDSTSCYNYQVSIMKVMGNTQTKMLLLV